ncbi:MAG: LptF/LptG family permease [Pyrinomonadaceae bacterium]
MHSGGRLIERYLLAAILPYALLALALLTTILFAQQSGRFAELLLAARVPAVLTGQLALAIVPNALVFTLPMATLAGIMVGFSRLGGDSELIAMRAAGIGTWRLLHPVLAFGLLVTAIAFYINLEVAPDSARALRRTLTQAAVAKLDSPVEPRAFNAEIPRYLIYIRDGDKELGQWDKVFIFSPDAKGTQRIVTARRGRIDASADQSELVLTDAVSMEFPPQKKQGDYVTTRLAQLRLQMDTGRQSLLEKLRRGVSEPDELKWSELQAFKAARTGTQAARDAAILQQKRLTLGCTPLLFALFGAGLGLRLRKGGRGVGILLSLIVTLLYYLLSLIGEQLSRAGTVPLLTGTWLASLVTLLGAVALLLTAHYGDFNFQRLAAVFRQPERVERGRLKGKGESDAPASLKNTAAPRLRWGFPSLLDVQLLRSLVVSFSLTFTGLAALFLIFTLFELWRFIVVNKAGVQLIARYLLFLMPLASVQLMPASVLVATLASYALLARRSEAIAWWASGQSVYRLMLPGVVFAALVGAGAWMIQERIMPEANRRQDALRAQIRGGLTRTVTPVGRQWLAAQQGDSTRLYAYRFNDENNTLIDPAIYEFDEAGVHLRRIIEGREGHWTAPHTLEIRSATVRLLKLNSLESGQSDAVQLNEIESFDVFKPSLSNPMQLSAKGLSEYISRIGARSPSTGALAIALQGKYAEPFGSLVLALVGLPLALAFGRRSAVMSLCFAVGIGLSFWGSASGFRQLGVYGLLPAAVAAWSPVAIFASIGGYLLTRTRT